MKKGALPSTNCGQSLSTATTSIEPATAQPTSSVPHYDHEIKAREIHIKAELQFDNYEENVATTAAAPDMSTFTATAFGFKNEVEEPALTNVSHHGTSSRSIAGKDNQDSFFAYNSLLSRMDHMLQNLPKRARPCYWSTSLLLQCPVCVKAYKGGQSGLPSLFNHIKVCHSEMRLKLMTVVRTRYAVQNECECSACYQNRVSKHPKDRIQLFNNLSDHSKSVVLETFQKLKGTL